MIKAIQEVIGLIKEGNQWDLDEAMIKLTLLKEQMERAELESVEPVKKEVVGSVSEHTTLTEIEILRATLEDIVDDAPIVGLCNIRPLK